MSIAESLRRPGVLDNVVGALNQYRKQKQLEENTTRLRETMTGGVEGSNPRGLGEMNADEILGMGDILRETPELTPQVELLQKAYAARQPEEFNLNQGEGRYSRTKGTNTVTPLVVNPARPEKQDKGNYIRSGKFVHDVFQQGDTPYEKPNVKPTYLRTIDVVDPETNVKKKADLYGWTDTEGVEHVTDKKYQDFTKRGDNGHVTPTGKVAILDKINRATQENVQLGKDLEALDATYKPVEKGIEVYGKDKGGKMVLLQILKDNDAVIKKEKLDIQRKRLNQKAQQNETMLKEWNNLIGGDYQGKPEMWGGENQSTKPSQNNGSYTIQEIRTAYPNVANKTDEEIISAYGNQGITVTP